MYNPFQSPLSIKHAEMTLGEDCASMNWCTLAFLTLIKYLSPCHFS